MTVFSALSHELDEYNVIITDRNDGEKKKKRPKMKLSAIFL